MQPNSYAVAYIPWCAFGAGCDEQEVLKFVGILYMQERRSC